MLNSDARLPLKHSLEFRNAEDQHEGFTGLKWQEAKPCVERFGFLVERLNDNGPRANHLGCRQGSFSGIDQQVGVQAPALSGRIHR